MEKKEKTIQAKGLTLGAGRAKVCISVMSGRLQDLQADITQAMDNGAELLEFRADYLSGEGYADICDRAGEVFRSSLGKLPVLFTYRTRREGGLGSTDSAGYEKLLMKMLENPAWDLMDVEIGQAGDCFPKIKECAEAAGKAIVASHHDFARTPPASEIRKSFQRMEAMGADIAKVAYMPENWQDVLALLQGAREARDRMTIPIIAISMGNIGSISRVGCSLTGSCLTFGSAEMQSAPGQLPAKELKAVLKMLQVEE